MVEAAVHEFAQGGLHGTPVDRIARRVGVAQPYVFSLFESKRELFIAAVERGFERTQEAFTAAAAGLTGTEALAAMGQSYVELLVSDRDYLMLQHQGYAACGDEVVRDRVRSCYARLVAHVERLVGPDTEPENIDIFFRHGMWLNVAAAMGVEDLSVQCEWIQEEGAA